jgi:hypothetical protein
MEPAGKPGDGLELLVEKWRSEFQRPENTNFYTQNDYKEAERKFIKHCLSNGPGLSGK